MKGARSWIAEVSTLDAVGFKKPPDLQFMANAILASLEDFEDYPAVKKG
jgi:hypothetical protein